jgi:membrane fusion protein, multidrug efflux system
VRISVCIASVLLIGAIGPLPASSDGARFEGAFEAGSLDAPRGIVISRSKAVLGSELMARIIKLPFSDGERFVAGDTLLEFDCRRYKAELDAARAEQRAAQLSVKENTELRRHRAVGLNELEISQAKFAQAKASADALAVRLSQCTIVAPFSGRVVEKIVNEFEIPKANEPLLKIIDDKSLEIELIVPSDWLAWLQVGEEFSFRIDETRRAYSVRLSGIGAAVDPISQTIRIRAKFADAPDDVLPGMSGSARFDKTARRAEASQEG